MILNKRDEKVQGADCFWPPQPVIKCLAGQACSNNPIKRQPCTNEARGGGDPIRSKTTTSKAIIITFNIINDSIIIITFAIDNGIVSILWPSDHLNLIYIIGLMRQRCKIILQGDRVLSCVFSKCEITTLLFPADHSAYWKGEPSMLFLIIQALCLRVKGHHATFVLKFARNAKNERPRSRSKQGTKV